MTIDLNRASDAGVKYAMTMIENQTREWCWQVKHD